MTKNFFLENISPIDYAENAVLAHAAAEHMLTQLELIMLQPKKILDAGCGTGYCTALLKQRYPQAEMIALDNSQAMLQFAKQQHATIADWVYADAATIPVHEHSVDLIFANFLLPWCDNVENILREWRRVLRPGGLLMFTSLGPDTLRELHIQSRYLPNFVDMHEVGDALVSHGFADPVLDVEYITLTYRELKKLFYEARVTGMLMGDEFPQSLEKNSQGLYTLTHEVIYGHAWRPANNYDHVADEAGIVKIPLAHLRRQR